MKKCVLGNSTNRTRIRKAAWLLIVSMLLSVFSAVMPQEAQMVQAAESSFVHPGILHTQESIDAMKANITNKVEPTLTAYNYLLSDGYSASDWAGRPLQDVVRGGTGDNRAQMYIDIERAYHTALLWKLGAGEAYGEAAVRILNGWSSTMKSLTGNADRFLAAGIYGYQMANAAELVRDHADFDKASMDTLLLNVFYPMNKQFLTYHNDASISNYWANWDLCNIASMIAIGVFTDREDIYNEAVHYYKNGFGMGSIFNTMPYVYEEGLAQWQEAGRDQGHATLGIGLAGAINEIAWSQGDDLYGMSDNRFLKAAEYVAKYNNTADADADNVPYSAYTRHNSANNKYETYGVVSNAGRPAVRPVYTAIYNHYVNRMGLEAPEMKKVLYPQGAIYVEGGQRNGDEPGWQSLTFHNVSTRVNESNFETVSGPLEDGIYRFTNNKSGKTLVDRNGVLQQAEIGSMESEWWQIKNINNGEYTITNAATGRVIQVDATEYTSGSAAYAAGTNFVLGYIVNGEMNQRLAILQKGNENIFRIASAISSHVLELANANIADDATICQWRYEGGAHQEWIPEKKEINEKIAEFNFNNAEDGLSGSGAKATANGSVSFVKDEERGKVLSLSNGAWLNVTTSNGNALLNGCKELTISYYSKVSTANTAWAFYAAADMSTQVYKKEKYLGIFENNSAINAERYLNGRQPSATASYDTGWKHVAVVYAADSIKVYVNGELTATAANANSLENILGSNSILQIGKANWGSGEYFEGLLDDFSIYSYALEDSEIEALAKQNQIAKFTFDNEETGLSGVGAVATANGNISFVDDEERGNVISLSNNAWLNVTKTNGSALLTGCEELTVSYYSKVNTTNTNWGFFAAADTSTQVYKKEKYLGIFENANVVNAERYNNGRQAAATASYEAGWNHIAVVYGKDGTKLYINGEFAATANNTQSIATILGENSILQIGKANWGTGEYYDGLLDDFAIYNYAMDGNEVRTLSDNRMVAEFTFDDVERGFESLEAKAVKVNTISLSEDAHSGKAASLNGNSYLKLVDKDGASLLNGWEEMTVSYWSKVDNTGANWMFYAAPNTNAQTYQREVYLGALESNGTLSVERYNNNGSRPTTNSQTADTGVWKHITICFDKNSTRVYVNGEKMTEVESGYALPDILGENSICYIGKANWGNGEYCNALIDNVRIYNYALSDSQVANYMQ